MTSIDEVKLVRRNRPLEIFYALIYCSFYLLSPTAMTFSIWHIDRQKKKLLNIYQQKHLSKSRTAYKETRLFFLFWHVLDQRKKIGGRKKCLQIYRGVFPSIIPYHLFCCCFIQLTSVFGISMLIVPMMKKCQ